MAKLAVSFPAIFFLLAFSHALTPSDLPENGVTFRDITTTRPESETKTTTIFLPTEKPESEPETTESQSRAFEQAVLDSGTDSVPLTVISFRPVNRHFLRRPFPGQLRHGHRCRHGHHQFKPWGTRQHGRNDIPYGNDMILSSEDVSADPELRRSNNVRQVPARWARFYHNHGRPKFPGRPRFPLWRDDLAGGEDVKRPHHHHHHDHDLKERKKRQGGFMMRFRKFLNKF